MSNAEQMGDVTMAQSINCDIFTITLWRHQFHYHFASQKLLVYHMKFNPHISYLWVCKWKYGLAKNKSVHY